MPLVPRVPQCKSTKFGSHEKCSESETEYVEIYLVDSPIGEGKIREKKSYTARCLPVVWPGWLGAQSKVSLTLAYYLTSRTSSHIIKIRSNRESLYLQSTVNNINPQPNLKSTPWEPAQWRVSYPIPPNNLFAVCEWSAPKPAPKTTHLFKKFLSTPISTKELLPTLY